MAPEQDDVLAQLQTLASEFARLSAASVADETRMKLLEETQKRHDEEIREIRISTGAMREQYSEILKRFDSIESKLFTLLAQTHSDSAKERTANQRAWISLIKYVLAGTIIALITYVFTRGGA